MVPTKLDNDKDGKPDMMSIDIVRPKTAPGVKVPVILESSPYNFNLGRGAENQTKKLGPGGVVDDIPLFYDNYFVPRGYAFVAMDNPGTGRSTGCMDVWGPEDVTAAVDVVKYLAGGGTAKADDGSSGPADWSTGKIAMIGKSYDGTIANAVAATGVKGLATIISVSGVSSGYGYARFGGIARYPGWVGWYSDEVTSRKKQCAAFTRAMVADAEDATADENAFWQQREIVGNVGKWTASALFTQGLTDWNVLPTQTLGLWSTLKGKAQVSLWLSQFGHSDPFDLRRTVWVDTLHRWLDHYLLGVNNGVEHDPPVQVQSSSELASWQPRQQWPATTVDTAAGTFHFGTPAIDGGLSTAPTPTTKPADFTDSKDTQPDAILGDPAAAKDFRLAYVTKPLVAPLVLSGTPKVTLAVSVTGSNAEVSVKLVDYGQANRVQDTEAGGVVLGKTRKCYGQSTSTDSACYLEPADPGVRSEYGVVAQGWLDVRHRNSLTTSTPFTSGQRLTLQLNLTPLDLTIPAGHRLAVVVAGSDQTLVHYLAPAFYTVDPAGSSLGLPVVG